MPIDADDNNVIDDRELEQFTEIMRCSSVTSVGSEDVDGHTDDDWTMRREVQGRARQAEEAVKNMMGTSAKLAKLDYCRTKFPRRKEDFQKAIVETGVVLSNGHKSGLSAYIEYADGGNSRLTISLESWDKASQAEKYRELFGADALQLGSTPNITRYGGQYYDMGSIANADLSRVIVEAFEKAMASLDAQGIIA